MSCFAPSRKFESTSWRNIGIPQPLAWCFRAPTAAPVDERLTLSFVADAAVRLGSDRGVSNVNEPTFLEALGIGRVGMAQHVVPCPERQSLTFVSMPDTSARVEIPALSLVFCQPFSVANDFFPTRSTSSIFFRTRCITCLCSSVHGSPRVLSTPVSTTATGLLPGSGAENAIYRISHSQCLQLSPCPPVPLSPCPSTYSRHLTVHGAVRPRTHDISRIFTEDRAVFGVLSRSKYCGLLTLVWDQLATCHPVYD